MKKIVNKITIGKAGSVDVVIPVIKFIGKKEGKKSLIIGGIHGDEHTGLLIIQKLITKIRQSKDINGEIWIIPSANPLAQALKTRLNPLDMLDLNRKFPGNSGKSSTDRLANTIYEIAKKVDFVLDLHTFEDPTVITGILMNCGNTKTKQKNLDYMKLLNPDVVWSLDVRSKEELKYSSSLGPRLAFQNIPNIAVELPQLWDVSYDQINRVVDGIINIFGKLNILNNKVVIVGKELTIVKNIDINSDYSGLFLAKKKLMDKVTAGDVVGELIDIVNFNTKLIKAGTTGYITILKTQSFVNLGDRLFTISKVTQSKEK
ncbi:succinylglutamate desuccinylase/aspartoacylase family protein [Patescibacteria group bacterium]|nr:succinylglutamate desuccinylase/aspartoacylase family protein [Patescibacteria group bacterium]